MLPPEFERKGSTAAARPAQPAVTTSLEELTEKSSVFCGFYRAEATIEDPTYPFLAVLRQILQAYGKTEPAQKVEKTIGSGRKAPRRKCRS